MNYEAIVIGASAGGINAIKQITSELPENFNIPIIIVLHIGNNSDGQWISIINEKSNLNIKEADEKEKIKPGNIYIAPPNYHLLIANNKTFALSIDERVNFARPSIDVTFESAAQAYKEKLIGIILTGSNNDGTQGMREIKKNGGLIIAEDPATAESSCMPASVIAAMPVNHILSVKKIIHLLIETGKN